MTLETQTLVAIIGIALSSIFAALGLFLNFLAVRKNNRIAVSTKLAELSKLLSDELVARVRMYQMLTAELNEAQAHPNTEEAAPKIAALKQSIEKNLARQSKLDQETEKLEKAFLELDSVDVGGVDAEIARSYRFQRVATSTLGYAEQIKQRNGA